MAITLSELIATCKGGRTYEQLSTDCGGAPTPGRIQQLATRPQRSFPDPETIEALARGLHVRPMAVLDACAVSLGIAGNPGTHPLTELLPDAASDLRPEQVAAVLAVVQAFVGSNRSAVPAG